MALNAAETGIKTVEVDRKELLLKLQENLKTHKDLYSESVKGYRDAKTTRLQSLLGAVSTAIYHNTDDNRRAVHVAYSEFSSLPAPTDHSESYELAIDIMSWENKDQIELSINDFQSYVRDCWNWKIEFRNSVSSYAAAHSHRI